MAALALHSPTQVAGTHSAIYEAYYHQIDPNGSGVIQAGDAARFLKKSKLSDIVLSKIWDLSDPTGKGYLDKTGLFVALKLVALAQAGKEISISNINSETAPPKLGDLPKIPPNVPPPPTSDWSIKPAERDKYNQLFESLQPSNGLIPGNTVKGVLMESKLPFPTLGRIWDLADQDKDGMLDRHEFIVAMHLVYKALEKHAIPAVLPPELRPPGIGGPPVRPPSRPVSPSPVRPPPPASAMPQSVPLIPSLSGPPPKPAMPVLNGTSLSQAPLIPGLAGPQTAILADIQPSPKPWVVTPAEKQQYDVLFKKADIDMDGFVSGIEIKDTFLQSGLPQPCLAHIWGLCDWDSSGKLSSEQFALAMWMVQRKLRGIEPPATLAPDMIPPSALPQTSNSSVPNHVNKEKELNLGPQPTPEMEALARDMEQLARERLTLEAEVSAKEQSIRVKTSEANNLQSELDTLAATLKQLENQKGEAQKRLNDLQAQVEKLRVQATSQEAVVKEAESEAATKREAVQGLKKQEQQLNDELRETNAKVDRLNSELQKSVLAISQANVKLTHLEEQEKQTTEAVAAFTTALAGGPAPAHQYLSIEPPMSPTSLQRLLHGSTPDNMDDDGFSDLNGPNKSEFTSDPFKDDPFSNKPTSNDPFAASFPANSSNNGFASDPFASSFGSSTPDPFGGDAFSNTQDNKPKTDDNKDPFGCDPFAILHAPTRDGSSPTPSLPPKKHKTPPPRPAPPRPQQPSASAQQGLYNNKLSNRSTSIAAVRQTNANNNNSNNQRKTPGMDFTEDPFRDYRYEDPFNLDDPFADVPDSNKQNAKPEIKFEAFATFDSGFSSNNTKDVNKNNSFAAFESDDFFSTSNNKLSTFDKSYDAFGGRQSAPPISNDPFTKSGRVSAPIGNMNNNNNSSNQSWATWDNSTVTNNNSWAASDDNWATTGSSDNWASPVPPPLEKKPNTHTWDSGYKSMLDPKADKKKDKSPKPKSKLPKSLSNAVSWGSLGRSKSKSDKTSTIPSAPSGPTFPTEQQQLAWATAEGKKVEEELRERRDREERELKMAMALSIGNQ